MYRIRLFIALLFGFLAITGFAKTMKIGILDDVSTSAVTITPTGSGYEVYADSEDAFDLLSDDALEITISGSYLSISNASGSVGSYTSVRLVAKSSSNTFKVKSTNPSKSERQFGGGLKVTISGSKLQLINEIDLELYLQGVLVSESGYGRPIEYYKIQAVISRTFALSNQYKHSSEGFHLCDQVHCQAYKGTINSEENIETAISNTKGEVIVDTEIELITASYHSNCGGQTCNSEDVWTKALPYLRSIQDTFCLHSHNSNWETAIDESGWVDYLDRKSYPIDDSLAYHCALNFDQDDRMKYFDECFASVKLTSIRSDWGLKSTYFETSIAEDGQVVLEGRGFGHGVGLCQEGAIEMADQGYSYTDILHFYYMNVHLVDLKYLDFFRDE